MADIPIHDGPAPAASSPREDKPPSSAGSQSAPAAEVPVAPPAVLSDELKARLDKVIYSDVSVAFYGEQKRSPSGFCRIACASAEY